MKADPVKLEKFLIWPLSLFALSLFFSQSGISIFGPLSFIILLYWRFKTGYEPALKVPKYVLVPFGLFVFSLAISILVSSDKGDAFSEFRQIWYYVFAVLLATAPMSLEMRRRVLTVFFASALLAGVFLIFQQVRFEFQGIPGRASGFTHPVHMAGILAIAVFSLVLALIVKTDFIPRTKGYRAFVLITLLLVSIALVSTQTRAVWISVIFGCGVLLAAFEWRKAALFGLVVLLLFGAAVGTSDTIKNRMVSIVTSLQNPTEGELGPRFVLWKGAFIMFKESPVVGTGSGDWDEINVLMAEGRVKEIHPVHRVQAHNLYIHWLATQGIIGMASVIMLVLSLLLWGFKLLGSNRFALGGLLVMSVLMIMLWGVTEANLLISKFVATWCFALGVFGGMITQSSKEETTD